MSVTQGTAGSYYTGDSAKRDSVVFETMEGYPTIEVRGHEVCVRGGAGMAICSQQGEEHHLLMP